MQPSRLTAVKERPNTGGFETERFEGKDLSGSPVKSSPKKTLSHLR